MDHPRYGAAKVAELLRCNGWVVSVTRVQRVRREDNLLAVRRRKFVVTTDSDHEFLIYPNLAQYMVLSAVNQLWVADITYLRLASEFVYFAVVLDAFSRRALGWAVGPNLQATLPLKALERAIAARAPGPGLVHHSDRGTQYASNDYVRRLCTFDRLITSVLHCDSERRVESLATPTAAKVNFGRDRIASECGCHSSSSRKKDGASQCQSRYSQSSALRSWSR